MNGESSHEGDSELINEIRVKVTDDQQIRMSVISVI